jgi:lysophospholipase L1-like esterase
MLGSNDFVVEDVTTNGDPTVIALYGSYIVTMANVLSGQGAQVIILSIPYSTRTNQTKLLAWVDGALAAATTAGVIGIDTCRPMIATGDPGQFLVDDVHLNDAGHALVRDLILAVI